MRRAILSFVFLSLCFAIAEQVPAEISVPCNLEQGICTRELELTPIDAKTPLNWELRLVPPESFTGMLEWRVSVWDGRKWGGEEVFAHAPFSQDRTTLRAFKKMLVRVKVSVFPTGAKPPASDVAIVAEPMP